MMPPPNLRLSDDPIIKILNEIRLERSHIPAPILRREIHNVLEDTERALNPQEIEEIQGRFLICLARRCIQSGFDLFLLCCLIYTANQLYENNKDNSSEQNLRVMLRIFIPCIFLVFSAQFRIKQELLPGNILDDKFYINNLMEAYKRDENLPQITHKAKVLNMWVQVHKQLTKHANGDTYSNPVSVDIDELKNDYTLTLS